MDLKSVFVASMVAAGALLGCASTPGPAPTCTGACAPRAPRRMIRPVAALNDPEAPLTAREAPRTGAGDGVPRTKEGGVGLTGPERPYVERSDSSGWSGRSTPPDAVGGGPAVEDASAAAPVQPESSDSPESAAKPPAAKESLSPAAR